MQLLKFHLHVSTINLANARVDFSEANEITRHAIYTQNHFNQKVKNLEPDHNAINMIWGLYGVSSLINVIRITQKSDLAILNTGSEYQQNNLKVSTKYFMSLIPSSLFLWNTTFTFDTEQTLFTLPAIIWISISFQHIKWMSLRFDWEFCFWSVPWLPINIMEDNTVAVGHGLSLLWSVFSNTMKDDKLIMFNYLGQIINMLLRPSRISLRAMSTGFLTADEPF